MSGVAAGLPAGIRLSDHISLGVIARAVPPERVRQVLVETGKASERERDLPAQVMVYYAIALALYMGSSTREVLRAAFWRACAGCGAPRRSGWRARAGFRRRAGGSGKVRCTGCMRGWCSRLPPLSASERGIGSGGWSAWTALAWRWPIPRRTGANLA